MDVSKPYSAVSPGVDGDVLTVLSRDTKPKTGSEIARLAGRSKRGVQSVLDRLTDHGLLIRQEAGASHLYVLNREHVMAAAVDLMASGRTELFKRLRAEFGAWEKPPIHASMFGSTARGDGDVESDVDLFIVRPIDLDSDDPEWERQIDRVADSVRRWTGNHAGISDISEADVERLLEDRPPVIEDLKRDAIDVAGKTVRKLLAGG